MPKTCEWCGGDLPGSAARFCSPACKNKGGVSAWRRRMRRRAVDYGGGKCRRCGYDRCVAALVFHHPSGKVFRISDGIARSWELIKVELDKCELICMNCHAELHHAMSHKDLPGEAERDKQLWIKAESPKPPKTFVRKCLVCGKNVSPGSTRCRKCSNVSRRGVVSKTTWPSIGDLQKSVESDGYEAVGRILGVTGKAVKKHILKYTAYAEEASEK